MQLSLETEDLKHYVSMQLERFFPDSYMFKGNDVDSAFELALERLEYCYKYIAIPTYNSGMQTFFSHLHGDQYSQFLYFLSNSLWSISENKPICDKIIQLNRMLSGMFYSYNSGLPDIFYWSHPVGTVLGKAKYSNFFSVRQNCTVTTQEPDSTPFGIGLSMGAGSSIYSSNITIGNRVAIGAGTAIYKKDRIADDTLVYRNGDGELVYSKRTAERYNERNRKVFNVDL